MNIDAFEQGKEFQTELAKEIPKALEEAKFAPSMDFEEFKVWLSRVNLTTPEQTKRSHEKQRY